ncbi:MAG: hemolysin III family protein [Myxococcota bacterium]
MVDQAETASGSRMERPLLRGVFHQYAFFVALGASATLLLETTSAEQVIAVLIYCASLCGSLGVSALYHRINWSQGPRLWMRRLDHSMIFVLIAATYTPFPLLVFEPPVGRFALALIWVAALLGVALKLLWIQAPDWLGAAIYVGVGFLILPMLPPMQEALGSVAVTLFVTGGVIYLIGALIFALKKPDPSPRVFGYHEIFHICVVTAASMHFVVLAYWVIP